MKTNLTEKLNKHNYYEIIYKMLIFVIGMTGLLRDVKKLKATTEHLNANATISQTLQ